MPFSAESLKDLLEGEDPLAWAWREMVKLFSPSSPPGDLKAFYDEQEGDLCALEQLLYGCYFEVYELLVWRALKAGEELSAARLFAESDFVIVADSLSVREAALFPLLLPQKGPFEVAGVDFFVAPLPSETKTMAQLLIGVSGPSAGRDAASFIYRYIPGPGAIPYLPPSGNLLIWLRLPDAALKEVTAAGTRTVEDALENTLEALAVILKQAGRHEALIISDHGYLYASKPSHYWPLPSSEQRRLQRLFGRAGRLQEDPEKVEQIRAFELDEPFKKRFIFGDSFAALRGRYWWATGSPNEPLTAHGGCSLPEVLVPRLRVKVA